MTRSTLNDALPSWPLGTASRVGLILLWTLASCGQSTTNNYGAAAALLGGTVLATGINRAVTGYCWANCTKGWYCDRPSGTCKRGECDPGCREGDYCVREMNGKFRCVVSAEGLSFALPSRDAGADPTGVSADAGIALHTPETEPGQGPGVPEDAGVGDECSPEGDAEPVAPKKNP